MTAAASAQPQPDDGLPLAGQRLLITGSARRLGRALALVSAQAGAEVIIHHGHSPQAAYSLQAEIEALGRRAQVLAADLNDPQQAAGLIERALQEGPLQALVNNAAIYEPVGLAETDLETWQRHLNINLTAPFVLSQAFAAALPADAQGRIVNILDWQALRPAAHHLPYMISKASLAALTRSLALALAPRVAVNGLALGAVLPPAGGGDLQAVVRQIPSGRMVAVEEVQQALLFLLSGPASLTGEIIHLDGGRHLV